MKTKTENCVPYISRVPCPPRPATSPSRQFRYTHECARMPSARSRPNSAYESGSVSLVLWSIFRHPMCAIGLRCTWCSK